MPVLLTLIFALFLSVSPTGIVLAQDDNGMEQQITKFIAGKNARIGVAVLADGKIAALVNNDFRYPLLSVFKLHQALAVCNYLQKNGLPLQTAINVSKDELHKNTYSPMREKYEGKDFKIGVDELLKYTIEYSDNNACDILFRHICTPSETDSFIRSLGLNGFSIAVTEDDMHKNQENCRLNWSCPLEVAHLLHIFRNGDIIANPYKSFLTELLLGCRTGSERLAKPLVPGSRIGHKTGTGDRDEKGRIVGMNDAGFIILPDGKEYNIVVLVADSAESERNTENIISGISGIACQYYVSGQVE